MEQIRFLKIEKKFKNNDFRTYFAKKGKIYDKTMKVKFEKHDILQIVF